MNNFFAAPTDVWGDDAVMLTPTGVVIISVLIAILIFAAMIVRSRQVSGQTGATKLTTKQLAFSAVALALAMVTSMIKLFSLPMGGAVTLLSMLFIVLVGNWFGPYIGLMTGVAYGLLQFVIEPIFYTLPQMIVDYPLAFGALGLAGFFWKKKNGLPIGYIVGVIGRFIFAFLSGVLFFAAYAPEGMSPYAYSAVYNGSYLAAEAVITLIIIVIPPVAKALGAVKKLATE